MAEPIFRTRRVVQRANVCAARACLLFLAVCKHGGFASDPVTRELELDQERGSTPSSRNLSAHAHAKIAGEWDNAFEQEEGMASFREHVRWIDRLVQESLAWRLRPWKVNQNVSVDVIEDGFGETLLRVISLQDHGTPGLMQVEVRLSPGTDYELQARGCKMPRAAARAAGHREGSVCAFADGVPRELGHMQAAHSETLLWKCGRSGLPEHLEAGRGGSHAPLPCSDLSHYKGKTTTHRFEKTYRFRSHDLPSSTHRIGFLFSAPQLGDTFYLHHLCWRPLPSDEEIKKGGHAEWECSVQ